MYVSFNVNSTNRLLYMDIQPLCTATMPTSRPAAFTGPLPWRKFIIHAILMKLERYLSVSNIEPHMRHPCTHPNSLTTRRGALHNFLTLLNLRVCDSYSANTCVELEVLRLPYSKPSRALGWCRQGRCACVWELFWGHRVSPCRSYNHCGVCR